MLSSDFISIHDVLGLGMVTPLGCGVGTTWKRLIDGDCGVRALSLEDLKMNSFDKETQLSAFEQLTSKVAALVPTGTNPGEFNDQIWLNSKVILLLSSLSLSPTLADEMTFDTALCTLAGMNFNMLIDAIIVL